MDSPIKKIVPAWVPFGHREASYQSLDDNPTSNGVELSSLKQSVLLFWHATLKVYQHLTDIRRDPNLQHQSLPSTELYERALDQPPIETNPLRRGLLSLSSRQTARLQGYHYGVLWCALAAAIVLIINLIFTIWALGESGVQNGLGTLFDGHCRKATTLTFWIHFLINILSTMLLGASNYTMQCLSAPTRSEVDNAHSQGVWLDIGVPNVRNLRRIAWTRIALWWLLAVSSIPLHLLYNSAVFSTLCVREYGVVAVTAEFLDGAPFNSSEPTYDVIDDTMPIYENYQSNKTSFGRLENKECVKTYSTPALSAYADLLLMTNYSNATNSYLMSETGVCPTILGRSNDCSSNWMCSIPMENYCNMSDLNKHPQSWSMGVIPAYESNEDIPVSIDYCLAQKVEEHCKLQFSLAIMLIVILCNLVKTICIGMIAWKRDWRPLVTLGDALASFLDRPDLTTEGNCLVERARFESQEVWSRAPSRWEKRPSRWHRTASRRRWLLCNIL